MEDKKILFLDFTCYKPYDPFVLDQEPLGGSESSVVRVAEGLAEMGNDVWVIQHNRKTSLLSKAQYTGLSEMPAFQDPDYVVIVRNSKLLQLVTRAWPKAKCFIWTQDLPTDHFIDGLRPDCNVVAVSNWHKKEIEKRHGACNVHVAYNPIDDRLKSNSIPFNKNKLVFFSSPHKGLEQVLQLFSCISLARPELKLYISNPGYYPNMQINHPNIHTIGQLNHESMMNYISDAFCVFYPNYVYPETFGIVFAEANALGIPVLTHDLGAASEVLDPSADQIINCMDVSKIITTLDEWGLKRPQVSAKPEFRTSEVLKSWVQILGE